MSWPAVSWALAQRAPSSSAKFLLTVIADAASVEDWLAWPSVAYLGEVTQQDRKTVLKNLNALEAARLIFPAGKAGKTNQVTVWRLPVRQPAQAADSPRHERANSPKSGTVSELETVPNFPRKGPVFPAKQSQKRDTEPGRNQSLTCRGVAPAARAPAADRGSRLSADWNPTEEQLAFCRQHRPDLNPSEVADRFRDYWLAQPGAKGRKSDWLATWRNWVRNERRDARGGFTPSAPVANLLDASEVFSEPLRRSK